MISSCCPLHSSTTVRNFTALARAVAFNWRLVDTVTLSYCKSVAQVIKERHAELANKFRSELPLQHPKVQQKKKESTKPTTMTMAAVTMATPPLAGENLNSSCQLKQRSLVDMPMTNMISPVLMLNRVVSAE